MVDLQTIKEQLYAEQPFVGGGTASMAQYEAHIEAQAQKRAAEQPAAPARTTRRGSSEE